ncbi:hypothetical protein HNP81_002885 [Peribacillus huizhouensis]|uniref:Uncharacterized protein n=1 Tax=Peribacillus huizhouensis TaxID=1501239 RepID=A0ABR6CRD9_9BACI|nr:hypothetical protein [Peribacillus huizhouensis]
MKHYITTGNLTNYHFELISKNKTYISAFNVKIILKVLLGEK